MHGLSIVTATPRQEDPILLPHTQPSPQAPPAAPDTVAAPFDYEALAQTPQAAQPASTAVPGVSRFADRSPVPAFSFLDELRPISSYPPSAPGIPPATPEADLASANLPFDLQLAHDYGRSPDLALLSSYGSFGFLDGARGLEFPASEPANEPLGIESDVPRDLNLSSYPFDAEAIRRDFPILRERVHGRPLVWLDNAATTQKPQSVIDRLKYFYEHENSNVHRAAHELAARATNAHEAAREKVRGFLNAPSTREIIFVRGATEGMNLIAQSWRRRNVQKDDEIAITWLEHHANIVPWQMLCA